MSKSERDEQERLNREWNAKFDEIHKATYGMAPQQMHTLTQAELLGALMPAFFAPQYTETFAFTLAPPEPSLRETIDREWPW